jgi:polar amino acid transport system permease protein
MNYAVQLFLQAAVTTVAITVASGVIGVLLSVIGGAARLSPFRSVRVVTTIYVEVFRGTSVLVQLFWLFFVLPTFGITLPPWLAGTLALSLNFGSYGSEIVRSGLEAVPRGQWDAASAMNLSGLLRFRLVLLPQALPVIIPAMTSNLVDLLKASSLLSLITATDMTQAAHTLVGVGYLNITVGYGLVLVTYFALAMPIVTLGRRSDAWASRHLRASGPAR